MKFLFLLVFCFVPELNFAEKTSGNEEVGVIGQPGDDQSVRPLSKRSIVDHYEDSHCLDSFETSDKTIIRTIESKNNGAVFLNNTEVETYERCLRFCCETSMCTVAVWDQQVIDPSVLGSLSLGITTRLKQAPGT